MVELTTELDETRTVEQQDNQIVGRDVTGGANYDIKPFEDRGRAIVGWQPTEFLPGLPVRKLLPGTNGLVDVAINFLSQGTLSMAEMQLDESQYLSSRSKNVREEARSQASRRGGREAVLCEALLTQVANWESHRQWWGTVLTHHQKMRHIWAQGRHVLSALEYPLGLGRFFPHRTGFEEACRLLSRGLKDIRLLTRRAQYIVLQIHALFQVAAKWAARFGIYDGSQVLALSARHLAEAAECLLDWRAVATVMFTKFDEDWAALARREQPPVTEPPPRVQFTLGNPLQIRLPRNFEGTLAAVWIQIKDENRAGVPQHA